MVTKIYGIGIIVILALALLVTPASAQMADGNGPHGNRPPQMRQGGQGFHQGNFRKHGKGGPRGPRMNPEQRKKMQAIRSTAEAHKELSGLFMKQGKTDEAVAELKKILVLFDRLKDAKEMQKMSRQIGHVYIAIAEIYAKKDRLADAQKYIDEGISKLKGSDPEIATKMLLFLGNIYQKQGKNDDAEKTFQRVIKLNAAALK